MRNLIINKYLRSTEVVGDFRRKPQPNHEADQGQQELTRTSSAIKDTNLQRISTISKKSKTKKNWEKQAKRKTLKLGTHRDNREEFPNNGNKIGPSAIK